MNRAIWLASLGGAVLLTPLASAYIRTTFNFDDGSVSFQRRTDNAGIQFYLNNKIVAGAQSTAPGVSGTVIAAGSDPVAAVRASLATWNSLPGANLAFLPLKSTGKVTDKNDGQMTILIGNTTSDLSVLGIALAITSNAPKNFLQGDDTAKGVIADSDIILNPAVTFSTDFSTPIDLQTVITHELGHSLGLNHSGLLGATMFQFATTISQRNISQDEVAFVTAVYPDSGARKGTVSGKVMTGDGGPVQNGLVTMIDGSTGVTLNVLTGDDGTYSLDAPPGSYVVYADPIGPGNVVQAGNLYLLTSQSVSTNFQTTMLGGFSSPTKVAVAAGGTVNVPSLTVTAGTSPLTLPYYGVGTASGSGDAASVISRNPLPIPSGRAADILLIGGGIDGTISVQAFGQGMTVRPGTVRVDPKVTFGGPLAGQPLVRFTVDLDPVQQPSLVSLIITKGGTNYAASGVFVLVPPQPAFVTQAVDSAASAQYLGAVSPGGITTIYDIPNTPNLGPASGVFNGGYDVYNKLPVNLAGVSVTFDGVPAPLFYVAGGQINLQVPFEVAGKTSTKVVINYLGSQSAPVTVPVVAAQPAFFMLSATDPFAANSDYDPFNPKPNSASNPAARGTVFSVYGTGAGKLPNYDATTGSGSTGPASGFKSQYNCTLGDKTFDVFGGWTPTAVGLSQWSFSIPSDSATGAVSIKCTDTVSGTSTQTATVYIR